MSPSVSAPGCCGNANTLEGAPDMIPIGRPVANTACYVLSEELRELRDGEVGELYIGGKQLAKGYHNREELNSERFIYWIDPSTNVPMRLYKTGDRVLRSQDGVLHFQVSSGPPESAGHSRQPAPRRRLPTCLGQTAPGASDRNCRRWRSMY
ncbi:AMP-binding protein [Bradyrhizobium viridifuturi]|uniref:AMP-binding protein n=1 Tax=Bradyrhizobium viridifuturi TaxID=1654716 RepID=UPI003D3180FB